jgi:hypothetical protein
MTKSYLKHFIIMSRLCNENINKLKEEKNEQKYIKNNFSTIYYKCFN